jgi:hypothetical protein
MHPMVNEQYRELARHIMAALITYRLNLSSVDQTLKDYIGDQNVGDSWLKFAADLDNRVSKQLGRLPKASEVATIETTIQTAVVKV